MTKDEIMWQFDPGAGYDSGYSEDAMLSAMDQYAKQQAVAFADWIGRQQSNVYKPSERTNELYDLFIKSI